MAFTNADKSKHGTSAQNSLEDILDFCVKCEYLSGYQKNYRIGKPGYDNDKQFYVPFLVEFNDGEKWALFSTTSMRTDRIKGQQWDAFNLKQIDSTITKAIIVYNDGVSEQEKAEFVRQNAKYESKYEYSEIDAILSQDELINAVEQHALRYFTSGKIKDKQGRGFEKRVEVVLSSQDNIKKWKTNDQTIVGIHYTLFEIIVNALKLDKEKVQSISAITDVPRLSSGGSPKADVSITVTYSDHDEQYGISCKRTSGSSVSVHQYSASAFSEVLDPENENLRKLLLGFQTEANMRDFGEENCAALTKALEPYVDKLEKWALGGEGAKGVLPCQCAQYILTYSNVESAVSIYSIENYISHLKDENIQGNFGTPFSWTYPSGRRGKEIVLKIKVI